MESPLMSFCDGREIIGASRDQLTINDASIPISYHYILLCQLDSFI